MAFTRSRYVVDSVVAGLEKKKKRDLIWGLVLSGFFLLGIVMGLGGSESGENLRDNVGFYAACLLLSLIPLYFGIRAHGKLNLIHRYSLIFDADRDGFVHLEELVRHTGRTAPKVIKELEFLFKEGAFQNCTLSSGGGQPGVILTDASIGGETRMAGFVNVKCSSCGGTSRIRANTVGVCEYCGSPIRADLHS